MSRILLAWELGDNYGHIATLLPVARILRQRGHQILFVVKNHSAAGELLKDEDFRCITSPRVSPTIPRRQPPASFADILFGVGFGCPHALAVLVQSWRKIFDDFKPDIAVTQYAPIARLSACLSGLPCLQLHTGFECPPDTRPFPSFRRHLRLSPEDLLARERTLLANINLVSSHGGHDGFESLQEVLKGDVDLLATLPELDHYRSRSGGCYIGPISLREDGIPLQWFGRKSRRLFVYLRPFPGIEAILKILKEQDAEVIVCVPGIDRRLLIKFGSEFLRISSSCVRLSEILTGMDVAITHAGHGTTAAVFLAGVPMLMIPTTVEQWLMSSNIVSQGSGIGLSKKRVAESFAGALKMLLDDQGYQRKAAELARKYADYDQNRVIMRIANTIERLPQCLIHQKMVDNINFIE